VGVMYDPHLKTPTANAGMYPVPFNFILYLSLPQPMQFFN
jgi:hypothetical protein